MKIYVYVGSQQIKLKDKRTRLQLININIKYSNDRRNKTR